MIISDLNLLIYAHSIDSPFYEKSRMWLENTLNNGEILGIPGVVTLGFVRLMTNKKLFKNPAKLNEVYNMLSSLFKFPNVIQLSEGERHFEIFMGFLLNSHGDPSSLATDSYIAAFAAENNCTLYSNDTDFLRFDGLRVVNPLKVN